MARAKSKNKTVMTSPPPPTAARPRRLLLLGMGFVTVAVVGVWLINRQVGGGRPPIDIAALERQHEVRRESIDRIGQAERLIRDGRTDEARQALERVIEADPDFFPGHLVLGYLFMRQGKLPLAEQATRRAYELEPNDHAVVFQLGQVELLGGKVESAIDLLARAIRLLREANAPPEGRYHLVLADALIRNGRPALAEDQLKRALEINREETLASSALVGPQTQVALARVLVDRREMSDAERPFEQAASQLPDEAEAQYQAARAYYVQGKFAQAAPLIDRAVELDPANPAYVQLRRQVHAGQFGSNDATAEIELLSPSNQNTQETEEEQGLFNPFK